MKWRLIISIWFFFCSIAPGLGQERVDFQFIGDQLSFAFTPAEFQDFNMDLTQENLEAFTNALDQKSKGGMVAMLQEYKKNHNPDDWLFYQLVRKTAQQISPKAENYIRYTLYKWYLLTRMGYDAILTTNGQKLLFYAYCEEPVYNIPGRVEAGKTYICLNYHDYGNIDFDKESFITMNLPNSSAANAFTYKIHQMPDFPDHSYIEKDISFKYYHQEYHFRVKMNKEVKTIFANYPTVEYADQFNIPLSPQTYLSLIPALRKNVDKMNVKNGVDFLMRFTRYAFLFKPDIEVFGDEKRLSPEQTLLYSESDCDDRAALFFYLVKEIYNMPMIVVAYTDHVTIGIELEKPIGSYVVHEGRKFTLCEPTPQKYDLSIGQILPSLKKAGYHIAYSYIPEK